MQTNYTEDNDQTRVRREHLAEIAQLVGHPYPSKFERSHVVEPGRDDTVTAINERFRPFEPQAAADGRPAPEAIEHANAELNRVEVRLSVASPHLRA
ncbi:MAG: hypothetical protein WKF30_15235 [Pyrinomonadaceae bacterium]